MKKLLYKGCRLMENETEEKATRQYAVKITEISSKIVYVEAESRVDAEIIAEEKWNNSEYVFDAEDFDYAKFEATESEE